MLSALNTLREIMDSTQYMPSVEEALIEIVSCVADAMNVDVCSVFLFSEKTKELSLIASHGLEQTSQPVSLKLDQGIVGYIAVNRHVVNVDIAKKHDHFKHLPEIHEEQFNAYLGIPIIHLRHLIGVLVVQDKEIRVFDEQEEAFLVTLGAHLAGYLKQIKQNESRQQQLYKEIRGLKGSPGIAMAKPFIWEPGALEDIENKKIKNIDEELSRFSIAIEKVKEECLSAKNLFSQSFPEEIDLLFGAYINILDGQEFTGRIIKKIQAGNWCPGAIKETVNELVKFFQDLEDPYFRARAEDILHLGNKLIQTFHEKKEIAETIHEPVIIFAQNLSVHDIATINREKLVGIVCQMSSPYSHTAILANALGIPSVMGVGEFSLPTFADDEICIVDGNLGLVFLKPNAQTKRTYRSQMTHDKEFMRKLESIKKLPSTTIDGHRVSLFVNTGLLVDSSPGLSCGAEGVGLFRSEFPFLQRNAFPSEDEQVEFYSTVLQQYAPSPVYMRTLDVGGDKVLPYFTVPEDNPNLGWRGIRFSLDNEGIFLTQLRAMLRADIPFGNLKIMVPMVCNTNEICEFRKCFELAFSQLKSEGYDINKPELGTMIEIPSLMFGIKEISKLVDFISIGSNDLTQYLLAVDRNNQKISRLYNWHDPLVLRAIYKIIKDSKRYHLPVSLCGEMASDPFGAILLIGMGLSSLSASAFQIPRIKWVVRHIERHEAVSLFERAKQQSSAERVEDLGRKFLLKKNWVALMPFS